MAPQATNHKTQEWGTVQGTFFYWAKMQREKERQQSEEEFIDLDDLYRIQKYELE